MLFCSLLHLSQGYLTSINLCVNSLDMKSRPMARLLKGLVMRCFCSFKPGDQHCVWGLKGFYSVFWVIISYDIWKSREMFIVVTRSIMSLFMTNKVKLSIWAEVWDWTGCFFFFQCSILKLWTISKRYRSGVLDQASVGHCFSFPVLLTPQLLRLRFTAFPVYQVFRVF